MSSTNIPDWVAATIRYIVTITGVLLVAYDVIEKSVWDEAAASLVSLLTALYGVIRTREIAQERDAAVLDLRIAKTMRSV
jgi:hypothetical protein